MTRALKFLDIEIFHSCSPLYICDWKTVKTESVSGDVLGTLRPREGVTWCCADRRTRRQLKARSRYFGNSSDRNSWGAGTRRRQTITASHRLLNYSDLPVVSSQEVKQSLLFCVVYCTTLAVSQTTWHGMVRLGMRRSWQNGILEGLMKTGLADDQTKIWTRYVVQVKSVFSYSVVRHFLCTSCGRGRLRLVCSVSVNSNSQVIYIKKQRDATWQYVY